MKNFFQQGNIQSRRRLLSNLMRGRFHQKPRILPSLCHSQNCEMCSNISAMRKESWTCPMSSKTIISILNIAWLCFLGWKNSLEIFHGATSTRGTVRGRSQARKSWKRWSSSTSRKFSCFAWGCHQLPPALPLDLWACSELVGDGGDVTWSFFRLKNEAACYYPLLCAFW